ncbi:MAG: Trk system potassium transporter TrkA [Gammaproteobacteria bacterium]|nr:Trk system potassium transporter TrkA [Gammaproteobacteria bacterium]MBT5153231.1 Trk system potassium transporter TrkA [Gammaproteobacteria bacterium]MBT5684398.1 Trk system potassium transporter TrkA [Gammaproteobacteria bacterium]MBT5725736.1 Trk system potassium transporter TrkA [Gammaproteobacteria bacterium]MBT6891371.1 Trk system potassium transporter TrkA [Gammaproteobacteria bacterium]
MKIIILGAGEVGSNLAQNLTQEASDITIVDTNSDRLRELQDRFDIRTVRGMASHPDILRQAGAEDADMLIAVTNSDEINMVACQVAYTVFNTPTKIARIRSSAYIRDDGIFRNDGMPVDVIVNPEAIVTHDIRRLIDNPGALQVMDFAEGQAQLVGIKAYYGGPLVDQELRYLRQHIPTVDTRVAAIFRKNRAIIPKGNTVIEADDEVFFIAASKDIKNVMSEMRRVEKPNKRVVIAGGGHIGEHLARTIEGRYGVRIIEHSRQRCYELSETLDRTIVLSGDASDRDLLLEENIEETDVFCAVTNDDEANIMSSMLAKSLGARKVITLINNAAYVDLIEGGTIDTVISPQQATLGSILTHIRRGDIARVHSLRRGAAEAIEAIAHGDELSSKLIGRKIEDIDLPPGTNIGAIVRGDEVVIAHDDIVVESGDHVVLFLVDKERIKDVEKLFQAPLSFF